MRVYHGSFIEIAEPIIEQLILDFNFDTETATDKFFTSSTFIKLANERTASYDNDWQIIYEALKKELS
jgi:hypothetical protein